MEELSSQAECAHIPCGCPVAERADYCSESCKEVINTTDCGCGHPECHAVG